MIEQGIMKLLFQVSMPIEIVAQSDAFFSASGGVSSYPGLADATFEKNAKGARSHKFPLTLIDTMRISQALRLMSESVSCRELIIRVSSLVLVDVDF